MKRKYASQQLEQFIVNYRHPNHDDMLVLTRMDRTLRGNRRSYWLHNPASPDPIPEDADTVGTVADVQSYYA